MIRPMLSDRCLSVTLVHFGQTVRWIKTKVGRKVGLGHGHIVYDGDPTLPPQRGTAPEIFGPYLLWPNGPMDQDATWYGGRPRRRQFCVRLGPCSPSAKGVGAPKFLAHVYCGQTAGWIKMALGMEVGLGPVHIVLRHSSPPQKGVRVPPPNFRSVFIVAKRLDASRCHLIWRWASA